MRSMHRSPSRFPQSLKQKEEKRRWWSISRRGRSPALEAGGLAKEARPMRTGP